MSTSPTDDLVARAVQGDRDAVESLLQQYGPQLRERFQHEIGTRWQSVLEIDDVLQVTFLEVFLRMDQFQDRGPGSFEAWLSRIARNNLLDAIRSLSQARQVPPERRVSCPTAEESSMQLLATLGLTTGTPSRHAVAQETHRQVQDAVAQLPRDYSQVLSLHDLQGISMPEVARVMQRTTGAVYMLRARALDFLRETLGRESEFEA
jgi:RNA polymerase sigma-70 factor (ECF subfamily)